MNGFAEKLRKAIINKTMYKVGDRNECRPHRHPTRWNWTGSQHTMKHNVTTIIVLMTFFCVLLRGFERLLASVAAVVAAAEADVDGPAVCCSV